MAQPEDPRELVTLQAHAVSNAYEIAALVAVLERKGILTQVWLLDLSPTRVRMRASGSLLALVVFQPILLRFVLCLRDGAVPRERKLATQSKKWCQLALRGLPTLDSLDQIAASF